MISIEIREGSIEIQSFLIWLVVLLQLNQSFWDWNHVLFALILIYFSAILVKEHIRGPCLVVMQLISAVIWDNFVLHFLVNAFLVLSLKLIIGLSVHTHQFFPIRGEDFVSNKFQILNLFLSIEFHLLRAQQNFHWWAGGVPLLPFILVRLQEPGLDFEFIFIIILVW